MVQPKGDISQNDLKEHLREEEEEKSRPEYVGEQDVGGSAPDPERIQRDTVLENAEGASLYEESDESKHEEEPRPLGIASEVDKDQKSR